MNIENLTGNEGLVIGRFQPLCKNHLELFNFVNGITEKSDVGKNGFVIAIGRPNYSKGEEGLSEEDFLRYVQQEVDKLPTTRNCSGVG